MNTFTMFTGNSADGGTAHCVAMEKHLFASKEGHLFSSAHGERKIRIQRKKSYSGPKVTEDKIRSTIVIEHFLEE